MLNFYALAQKLEEASRREQMGYVDPHAEKEKPTTKTPQEGDIVITSTSVFFSGPKARAFYNKGPAGQKLVPNTKISPWFLSSGQRQGAGKNTDLIGKTYYDAVYVFNPSKTRKFVAEDILYDVTDAYPPQDRYGRNVWLYISSADPEKQAIYQKAYEEKFLNKHHVSLDPHFSRQADKAEDEEKAKLLKVKASLVDDPRKAVLQHAANEKLGFYKSLNSQVTTMLKKQDDPTILLKRTFADDQEAKRPEFRSWLRRKNLNILADYLEGIDIRKAFAPREDDLNQRLAAKQPAPSKDVSDQEWETLLKKKKETPPEDKLDKLLGQYRQAQKDERDPKSAFDKLFPNTKAENLHFHGAMLLGESTRTFYRKVTINAF